MEETSAQAFAEALQYEEQMKLELDPRTILHCRRERDWWLEHAAELERKGK